MKNGPWATLPNNTTIQATLPGNLHLHPTLNHTVLLFLELHSESLLSIGKLCDEGCIASFYDKTLNIYRNDTDIGWFLESAKSDNLVLKGDRNQRDGSYDVPSTELKSNFIIHKDKDELELVQYLHGCAFSPAISTFQESINKGNFIT